MKDDFKNVVSLGSKNDKDNWSPREMLLHLLGQIDRGEVDPTQMVCVWTRKDPTPDNPDSEVVESLAAKTSFVSAVGMLSIATHAFANEMAE